MSTIRNPVGPQPPSVYWRRRLIVLLGIVAVIVIIALIVWNGGRSGEEARETPAPSGTPTETASAGAEGECNPAVIAIEPVTDASSYASGVNPMISMNITNTGSRACTFDVGASAQQYLIVSGSDPIWDSSHCLSGAPLEQELQPNVTLTTTPIAWDRTRSDPSTCDTARPAVTAEGATYRLSVKLGDIESTSDTPFLLN